MQGTSVARVDTAPGNLGDLATRVVLPRLTWLVRLTWLARLARLVRLVRLARLARLTRLTWLVRLTRLARLTRLTRLTWLTRLPRLPWLPWLIEAALLPKTDERLDDVLQDGLSEAEHVMLLHRNTRPLQPPRGLIDKMLQ